MKTRNIKVLLIEDNINDVRLINEFLAVESRIHFEVDCADNLLICSPCN